MVTGKSKTNKSYKLGVQYAKDDFAAGLSRRLTYMERKAARERGEEPEYRPMAQLGGYYASEMERGYQETWKALEVPVTVLRALETVLAGLNEGVSWGHYGFVDEHPAMLESVITRLKEKVPGVLEEVL